MSYDEQRISDLIDGGLHAQMEQYNDRLTDVSKMTRNDVVPYYMSLIMNPDEAETIRVNQLILSKWTSSGLNYIKEKAWNLI